MSTHTRKSVECGKFIAIISLRHKYIKREDFSKGWRRAMSTLSGITERIRRIRRSIYKAKQLGRMFLCGQTLCRTAARWERETNNRRIFIILCEIWQNLCCCLSVCWPNSHITNQLAILTNKEQRSHSFVFELFLQRPVGVHPLAIFSLQIGSSAINRIIKSVKNSPRAISSSFLLFSNVRMLLYV